MEHITMAVRDWAYSSAIKSVLERSVSSRTVIKAFKSYECSKSILNYKSIVRNLCKTKLPIVQCIKMQSMAKSNV